LGYPREGMQNHGLRDVLHMSTLRTASSVIGIGQIGMIVTGAYKALPM